ncbi:MAG: vitamin B12-dependent ribonucleotide reductase [Thermoplasmata archaeon]|nr:MAG: vitamin B12-dependent ribonucleotide reductase [Thermoplasmata archaeon]KAA0008035.1 MAG: vitamin B12-dependent ribonucleotide reductase [Thermoplasmata archaeon]
MAKLTKNALKVLEKRYLLKDENGKVIETPDQMFHRVAHDIALADEKYGEDVKKTEREFYEIMSNLLFIPNSPTLMNAGTSIQQLSACFVIPIEDSMKSIFEAVKNTALIHQSGGGTGFSFSRIRPKGDIVKSTGGVASGPISFMKVFNAATDVIKQGGRRRGANMGILHVTHPDILEFIKCKDDPKELTNFNISVAVSDEFMEKVEKGEDYELINPRTKEQVGKLNAKEVFDMITEHAWRTGEPGIIFLDEINRHNPTPHVGMIESTNPCGEQPLLPYESCNLGSINLSKFVKGNDIDWDALKDVVWKAVHFLDNVIDRNKYPIPQIKKMTLANRKIGLGVMGFADLLIQLRIPYDSEEALEMAEKIMKFIQDEARMASVELGKQRGSFPNFKGSIWDGKYPAMRNATVTTIAPTGTISIIAGCSSGIEPLFAISFMRNVLDKGDKLYEVNPYFEKIAKELGFYSDELMKKIAENNGSVKGIEEVPVEWQRIFVTALDIDPEWHVRMQASFQKYTDNATSKTINLREEASIEDVRKAYMLAYKLKCKGITVYRYGSRPEQVLVVKEEEKEKGKGFVKPRPRPRPTVMWGVTRKMEVGCGNLYVTMNEDEHGLFEVFARLGKAGGCADAQLEAIGRLISLCLRSGIETRDIIKQLKGIRCPNPLLTRGGTILSCPDAIAKALEEHIEGKEKFEIARLEHFEKEEEEKEGEDIIKPILQTEKEAPVGVCPECGSPLVYEEGCKICKNCGYSTCG